jgi:hypothetical protein
MKGVESKPRNLSLFFLVFVSIFGLLLSVLFVFSLPNLGDDFEFRRIVVGSVFGAVCVLGIIGGLYPRSCSSVLDFQKLDRTAQSSSGLNVSTFKGHHPTCGCFSSHLLHFGERRFCATCSGLVVGAVVVLFGVGFFFFGNIGIMEADSLLVVAGAVGVAFGLLHPSVFRLRGVVRFFASTVFVVGAFLVLVSVEDAVKNTSIDLFLVLLSVLWILTKVSFSRWEHQQICSHCSLEACGAGK